MEKAGVLPAFPVAGEKGGYPAMHGRRHQMSHHSSLACDRPRRPELVSDRIGTGDQVCRLALVIDDEVSGREQSIARDGAFVGWARGYRPR